MHLSFREACKICSVGADTGPEVSMARGISPYRLTLTRINGYELHDIDFVRAKNFTRQSLYIITDLPMNFIDASGFIKIKLALEIT